MFMLLFDRQRPIQGNLPHQFTVHFWNHICFLCRHFHKCVNWYFLNKNLPLCSVVHSRMVESCSCSARTQSHTCKLNNAVKILLHQSVWKFETYSFIWSLLHGYHNKYLVDIQAMICIFKNSKLKRVCNLENLQTKPDVFNIFWKWQLPVEIIMFNITTGLALGWS